MQCKPVTTLPSDEKWTFEIKFDGYRCIALRARCVEFGACDAQDLRAFRVFYATLTIPITSLRTSYGSRVLPAAVQASIKPKDGRATPEVRFENDGCFFTWTLTEVQPSGSSAILSNSPRTKIFEVARQSLPAFFTSAEINLSCKPWLNSKLHVPGDASGSSSTVITAGSEISAGCAIRASGLVGGPGFVFSPSLGRRTSPWPSDCDSRPGSYGWRPETCGSSR